MKAVHNTQADESPTLAEARRELILMAMVRVAGDRGYAQTTVADVVAEAKLAETDFNKHFETKEECFLAAFDMAAGRLVERTLDACEAGRPWIERMRAGLEKLVEELVDDPASARVAIVEAVAAGAAARRRYLAALERLSSRLEPGRELSAGRDLPQNISLMAAGSVSGLLFDEIAAGRTEALPRMLPDLMFALLVPFVGPSEADGLRREFA